MSARPRGFPFVLFWWLVAVGIARRPLELGRLFVRIVRMP